MSGGHFNYLQYRIDDAAMIRPKDLIATINEAQDD